MKFGIPTTPAEQLAHDWLQKNCGCEGESVMKSLAKLLMEMMAVPTDDTRDLSDGKSEAPNDQS